MEKRRIGEIDMLRGISMLAMILIHTNAYYLSNRTAFFLWDYSQFAVPVFIFCSAYLFFQKQWNFNMRSFFSYVKKRILRLLIPYYLFLPVWFLIIYFAKPATITTSYFIQNLTLTGGMDINWLILLFLTFIFIIPAIAYMKKKQPIVLLLFALASVGSTFLFLFSKPPFSYKFIMWLPWSLVILYSLYVVTYEKRRWFFPITIIGTLILFFLLRELLISQNHSLIHYRNKYPPNLYNLSYGLFFIPLLFQLARWSIFSFFPLKSLLVFLSKHSYPVYFIHYFIIFFITLYLKELKFIWESFFITVLIATIMIQWTLNYFLSTLKRGPTI